MQTYKIELRVDYPDDDPRWDITREAVLEKARELYTMAVMLKDKREPRIAVETGDMFLSEKDINIIPTDS